MLASSRYRRCRVTASFLVFGLLLAVLVSNPTVRAGGPPKKGQGQYQIYILELKNRFLTWDVNGDNVLDKDELAKAFRGKQAKPYDYVAPDTKSKAEPVKYITQKAKAKPYALALACLPKPGLAVNLALAELLTKPEKIRIASKEKEKDKALNPAVMQYGDFQFLTLVGGKDDKISKQEFDNWATTYAKNLDRHHDLQKQVKASQDKLTKAKNVQTKQAASNELVRHQADLNAVSVQLNAISPAIHKALNVKK